MKKKYKKLKKITNQNIFNQNILNQNIFKLLCFYAKFL
jgi:hypothetical protein